MAKLVFVLLDGLSHAAAQSQMCYLRLLQNAGLARAFCLRSQMPPLSRPVYATLLTGLTPLQHGILRNEDIRPAPKPNIFTMLKQANLHVCAAAYSWFYELCEGMPFDPLRNRFWHSKKSIIPEAVFYHRDDYPDAELFADAEALRQQANPDFMLVHCMGIDWAGHSRGGDSNEYRAAASNTDALLAFYAPLWLADGYSLLIASDHGMGADGTHYSLEDSVMNVPLWLVGKDWPSSENPAQTDIAGVVARFFGLGSKIG